MGTGHGRSEADRSRLLRVPPPESALRWVLRALSADAVEDVVAMPGGTSSAMHRLEVRAGTERSTVVLRRYVLRDVLDRDPAVAAHEVDVLRLLERSAVPTAAVLAADPAAAACDVPAIVMTAIPGRVVWEPARPTPWLDRLAETAVSIHAVAVDRSLVAGFRPYVQDRYDPPRWASHPQVWERAVELFHERGIDRDTTFIHRDYHPGNVLWSRRAVAGVVDWQAAAIGPPSLDIAHCRLNLLLYRPEWAEQLRRRWERLGGRTFHPWSDVIAIIGMLDDLRARPPSPAAQRAIDTTLTRAVADVTG